MLLLLHLCCCCLWLFLLLVLVAHICVFMFVYIFKKKSGSFSTQHSNIVVCWVLESYSQVSATPQTQSGSTFAKKDARNSSVAGFSFLSRKELALSPMFSVLSIICSGVSPTSFLRKSCLLSSLQASACYVAFPASMWPHPCTYIWTISVFHGADLGQVQNA